MASYSPLRYPGGKYKTYKYIEHLVSINNVTTYIEPFAGGAAVPIGLLLNNKVDRIFINDYDKSIYSLWYIIKHHSEDLINLITNTPINMDQWRIQKDIQLHKEHVNELTLAFSTLFLNRTNRSGILKAGVIGGKNQDGNYKLDCRFNKETIISRIRKIANCADRISVTNQDAIRFIENEIVHTNNSLTFFDPPYYVKGPNLYTNFYVHDDHVNLSQSIHDVMRNRHWILTYDLAPQISDMYNNYEYIEYYLKYSISSPTNGKEYMFFSNNLIHGEYNKYLKVVNE